MKLGANSRASVRLSRWVFYVFLLFMGCLASDPASALSCDRPVDLKYAPANSFGSAKVVFVGKLVRLVGQKQFHGWHHSVDALFEVERTLKGDHAAKRVVAINVGHSNDQRFAVYATVGERGELRADDACSRNTVELDEGAEAVAHLAYLSNLPPSGSGGGLSLRYELRKEPYGKPITGFRLEFAGAGGKVAMTTDSKGMASLRNIREGVYRLVSEPLPGYRFDCSLPCDAIRIHDRGHTEMVIGFVAPPLQKRTPAAKVSD